MYPFCTCKNKDCRSSLYFHIGLCPGPYANKISKEDYRKNINNVVKILSGRKQDHINRLTKEMEQYSKRQEYEKASQIRDRINDLKYISQDINFTYYDDIDTYQSKRNKTRISSLKYLCIELGIKNLDRIECYDISNIQGKHAYGSMVVATEGKLDRSEYRIYKIKNINTPNDFKMLEEVLGRRFKHTDRLPDLILIDGGKGQLNSIKKLIPKGISILGISKGKHLKRKGELLQNEFWYVKDDDILRVDLQSPELLVDLRDEAHRFAITHFRKESIRSSKRSILDSIEGIGVKRRKELLRKFGDIDGIKKASFEDIYSVVRNRKVVQRLQSTL